MQQGLGCCSLQLRRVVRRPLRPNERCHVKRLVLILWRMSRADLRMLWHALSHPERPTWLRPATVLLLIYALAPFNFVIPVLGIVDDFVLVPLVLHFLLSLLPRHVRVASWPPAAR